ncbi:MAG: hypothetical protein J6E46_13640 [Faecalicoccus sp.]|nr:hypothetical protein [Faecalicoccus sp.]
MPSGLPAKIKTPRLLTRLRLDQELTIIKERNLGFGMWFIHLLFKEFVDQGVPFSTRGAAGDSFILYLLGLTHYNPVEKHLPALFFYGTESKPRPLSYQINLSKKDRQKAIQTLCDMLKISINEGEVQRASVVEVILQVNSLGSDYTKTEFIKDNGTLSILVQDHKTPANHSFTIRMYLNKDVEVLCQLSNATSTKVPRKPEKENEIFSVFEQPSLAGIGSMDHIFIREYVLDTIHPHSVSDLARLLGLAHSSAGYTKLQRPLLKEETINLTQTISGAEDIYHILRKYDFSEEYAYDLILGINKHTKKIDEEIEKELLEHGIPDIIVKILKEVSYVFYAGQNYDYAWQLLALAYYKYHYPELFESIINGDKS